MDKNQSVIKEPSYQDILDGIKKLRECSHKGSAMQVPSIILKKSFVELNLNPGTNEIVTDPLNVNRVFGCPTLVIEDEDFEKIFKSKETYAFSTLDKEYFERISILAAHYKNMRKVK